MRHIEQVRLAREREEAHPPPARPRSVNSPLFELADRSSPPGTRSTTTPTGGVAASGVAGPSGSRGSIAGAKAAERRRRRSRSSARRDSAQSARSARSARSTRSSLPSTVIELDEVSASFGDGSSSEASAQGESTSLAQSGKPRSIASLRAREDSAVLDDSWYDPPTVNRRLMSLKLSQEPRRDSMFLGSTEFATTSSPDVRSSNADLNIHPPRRYASTLSIGGHGFAATVAPSGSHMSKSGSSSELGSLPFASVPVNSVVSGEDQSLVDPSGHPVVLKSALRARVDGALDSVAYLVVVSIVTLYVLYIDDAIVVAGREHTDDTKRIIFAFLVLKFIVFNWARRETYPFSFFFWLDILALVSFVPDLLELFAGITSLGLAGSLAVSRAGRAAQASSRAVRASKLAKAPLGTLIQVTTNKVTVLVLLVYFASLLLQVEAPLEDHVKANIEAVEATMLAGSSGAALVESTLIPALSAGYGSTNVELLHMWSLGTRLAGSQAAVDMLNPVYVVKVVSSSRNSGAEYSVRHTVRLNAGLNIVLITILLAALILGSYLISKDADRLIKVAIHKITRALMAVFDNISRKAVEPVPTVSGEKASGSGENSEATVLLNMLNTIGERAGSDAALVRRLRQQREEYLVAAKRMEMELRQWRRTKPTAHIGRVPLFSRETEGSDPLSSEWIVFADESTELSGAAINAALDAVVSALGEVPQSEALAKVVLSGSVPGLVGWLVSDLQPLPFVPPGEVLDYTYVLMVNYRSFMDPAALLEDLIMAYCRAPPKVTASQHRLIEEGITPEEMRLVREMFARFDADGNGTLSRDEMAMVLSELDRGCTPEDVETLMTELDEDQSGEIDFDEFFNGLTSLISSREAALEAWKTDVLEPLRRRVALVLEYWITQFTSDFVTSPDLLALAETFLGLFMPETGMEAEGDALLNLLDSVLSRAASANAAHVGVRLDTGLPPLPRMSGGAADALLAADPVEIARQLTLVDARLYGAIQRTELVDGAHMSENKNVRAPNVSALVAQHNAVSRWVEASILAPTKIKERVAVIKLFVHTMVACSQLSNFNGVMAIYAALQGTAIDRLRKTWAKVPKDVMSELEAVGALMSYEKNFKAYRSHVAELTGPSVPYLGIYFKDLIGVDEGNEKRTANGFINMEKCYLTAFTISELLRWQPETSAYTFVGIDEVQALWREFFEPADLRLPLGFDVEPGWVPSPPTEDDLFKLSLEREPRVKR
ncbi:uncharacterized protein AMSG_01737 [Thecamonas trahens ATCC 50062]|uniref:Uncharacterized protein n=1 Tax=Thecamonas trahens ATCC 50062 TaxID=461836 RepID=A0A0L0DVA2_THETB|nr:hypothetical protein AMSG_01737 [Thecamonas trahens ATCC 50062]KNC55473.1 hypothetical protein AMSG_01737 [Thecamonas trahens ATCC 50062]|eukprot:XP_013761253.1 hypothetical protein AMSG_01737 [Thecamonas trahens ATCC 50062]